jgi:hypothetical protein
MSRGRIVLSALGASLAVLAPAQPALAAKPLLGTVQRGWISRVQPGTPLKSVPAKAPALYANFVWLRSPTAGLPLEMQWIGPQGFVRASWKSTTLKSDRPGTRLYSRVANSVFRGSPGTWRVRLMVNDVIRGNLQFRVTS